MLSEKRGHHPSVCYVEGVPECFGITPFHPVSRYNKLKQTPDKVCGLVWGDGIRFV